MILNHCSADNFHSPSIHEVIHLVKTGNKSWLGIDQGIGAYQTTGSINPREPKWNVHIKNLINALHYKLFQIRRISNQKPREQLMKVVHSVWFLKLRCGTFTIIINFNVLYNLILLYSPRANESA